MAGGDSGEGAVDVSWRVEGNERARVISRDWWGYKWVGVGRLWEGW